MSKELKESLFWSNVWLFMIALSLVTLASLAINFVEDYKTVNKEILKQEVVNE